MLRRFIRALERRKLENALVLPKCKTVEFDEAVKYARLIFQNSTSKEEQMILLDYMLTVIREDLKTDLLSTIFYSKEHFEKTIAFPFPRRYYDETGTELELRPQGKRIVDLSTDYVLVLPWRRDSLSCSIITLFANEFMYDEHNHKAAYYSGVDICYVNNGIHSISAGVVYKKGHIKTDVYNVVQLFDHVHTNGESWYNSHNNQKLGAVFDFRVGIIYEIAKLKHQILNGE